MKASLSGLFAAALFTFAPSVSAALISPISASTTLGSGFGTDLINTINGVGLASLSLTATHGPASPFNSWLSAPVIPGGVPSGDITFDLGGVFSIQGLSFWNQNGTFPGPGPAGGAGIRNLVISSSLDNVTFTPIVGAPVTFAPALAFVSIPQQFSFGAVNATHLRFSVASNYGAPGLTGFAEVQFNGVAASVPDSGDTLALLGTILLGFAAVRRGKSTSP